MRLLYITARHTWTTRRIPRWSLDPPDRTSPGSSAAGSMAARASLHSICSGIPDTDVSRNQKWW